MQVLNSLVKSSNEETQLFLTLIKSTHYCIAALLGEGEESEVPPPSSLIIPDLAYSQKGTDQIKILVNGVGGLTYLLRLCLLVDTCRPLDVPLDQLWGLIWRMMNNQVIRKDGLVCNGLKIEESHYAFSKLLASFFLACENCTVHNNVPTRIFISFCRHQCSI